MIWFSLVLWHINHYILFNTKSYLYIYIRPLWFLNTFYWEHFKTSLDWVFGTLLKCSKYCYVSLTIELNISYLFALSLNSQTIPFDTLIEWTSDRWQWKGYSVFPKSGSLAITLFNIISWTLVVEESYSLQSCSRYFLQPQPTGPLVSGGYPSAEMQLLYSTAPADWAERFSNKLRCVCQTTQAY